MRAIEIKIATRYKIYPTISSREGPSPITSLSEEHVFLDNYIDDILWRNISMFAHII
jgi:hypothetical protein